MAVLVEFTSVIVRRDAIDRSYAGGWKAFASDVPNATLCSDTKLARIGFMSLEETERFTKHLESYGLKFLSDDERCVDIAVVDEVDGLEFPCRWLGFAHLSIDDSEEWVAACWLDEDAKAHAAAYPERRLWKPGEQLELAIPSGRNMKKSKHIKFVMGRDVMMQNVMTAAKTGMYASLWLAVLIGTNALYGLVPFFH